MKRIILAILALGLLTCDAHAQNAPSAPKAPSSPSAPTAPSAQKSPSPAPALATQKEKLSYAIGMEMGKGVKAQGIEVDSTLLMQGLKDALNDVITDGIFVCQARRIARTLAAKDVPAFLYHFTHALDDPRVHELGATHTISQVTIDWEAAYATAFQLQTSNDGTTWTTIYSTTTGTGGTQTIPVSGSGRYVRMYGTARATGYGYSIWEFQVYGT